MQYVVHLVTVKYKNSKYNKINQQWDQRLIDSGGMYKLTEFQCVQQFSFDSVFCCEVDLVEVNNLSTHSKKTKKHNKKKSGLMLLIWNSII